MPRPMFSHPHELAKLFTQPAFRDPETQGKYLESGMKPIEEFCNDIMQNLVSWSYVKDVSVFYRTERFLYEFRHDATQKIVWMTRYELRSWLRMDDWANESSLSHMGREFCKKHIDKFVPLFAVR